MTDPMVWERLEEEDGALYLHVGIDETDDAEGLSVRVGPLPLGTTIEAMDTDARAKFRQYVVEQWREMLGDMDGFLQRAVEDADHVHITLADEDADDE